MRIATLARLLIATHPELTEAVKKRYTPAMTDYSHIPTIHAEALRLFPDLDDAGFKILFVGTIYKLYCPETLVGSPELRAPSQLRSEINAVLGYTNGTVVNYWKSIAQAYLKQPAFKSKVDQLTEIAEAL